MGKRSVVSAPVYRAMIRHLDNLPTCVVAGPSRRVTWLYVHGPTPTVVRLHPPVVRFLRDVVAALPDVSDRSMSSWLLPRDTRLSYPQLVTGWHDPHAWLHMFTATPSTVPLAPRIVAFLREALADLPATATPAHTEVSGQPLVFPLHGSGT